MEEGLLSVEVLELPPFPFWCGIQPFWVVGRWVKVTDWAKGPLSCEEGDLS